MTGLECGAVLAKSVGTISEVGSASAVAGSGLSAGGMSEMSGVCSAEALSNAEAGVTSVLGDGAQQFLNSCRNLIAHQAAGEIGGDNESLSIMARAAAVYACGELNADKTKITADAQRFDSAEGIREGVNEAIARLGAEVEKHFEKGMGSKIAKAMAYSALIEINKMSGNGEAQLLVGPMVNNALETAFCALSNLFRNPQLSETMVDAKVEQPEDFSTELKNNLAPVMTSNLQQLEVADVVNSESIKEWVINKFLGQIDRATLDPKAQELYDVWKNVDMKFLQKCADDVSKVFKLHKLPVERCGSDLFYHCTGRTSSPYDDFYGGNPDFVKEFITAIADMHPEIRMPDKAEIFTKLIYAHEAGHYMFSQSPLEFPRAVEELACDFMTKAYAIKASSIDGAQMPIEVVNDMLKCFFEAFNKPNNDIHARVFDDEGKLIYPSCYERSELPGKVLDMYVGVFKDFAPDHFLPGSTSFSIERVGVFAAQRMGIDLVFNPDTGVLDVKDSKSVADKSGDFNKNCNIDEGAQSFIDKMKAWAEETIGSLAKNKGTWLALAQYIRKYV